MNELIDHLYYGSRDQAIQTIITKRNQQSSVCVNYLYGANIVGRRLLDPEDTVYRQALLAGDFLLVDGIALQVILAVYFLVRHREWRRYPNLNGTDVFPAILQTLSDHNISYGLILYGTTPVGIEQSRAYLAAQGYTIIYAQDGFRPFDRDAYTQSLHDVDPGMRRVFVQGRSSIHQGIQEERWYDNKDRCGREGRLVCNQGGLFDHSSMGGRELRAPGRVQTIKAERIRRLCIHPQKNRKKVWYSFVLFPSFFWFLIMERYRGLNPAVSPK